MSKKASLPANDDTAARSRTARFSDEFKRNAVRLVSEEKYTFRAAAAAVNVSTKSLRDWYALFAPKPVPCGDDATLEQLREENTRLRQQLRRAELEREILKKATAYFAKESL
jgi:transposase